MKRDECRRNRDFLKDYERLKIDFRQTEQNQGVPPPPLEKPVAEDQTIVELPGTDAFTGFLGTDLCDAIARRRSRRRFLATPLQLTELAFLLWASQGVTRQIGPGYALRTVPSAGCRHAFETYLFSLRVDGLDQGLYRYLPVEHALVGEPGPDDLAARLPAGVLGQTFVAEAAAVFVWAAVPHRMEWRYHTAAHRVIAMDVGHVCQNLYLACEAIEAGTCAVAAYDQDQMDALLGLDGQEEFTLYLAPVGKI